MTLVGLLVVLIIVGLVLYLVNTLPIDATVKRIIHIVVVVIILLWLLSVFGLIPSGAIRLK